MSFYTDLRAGGAASFSMTAAAREHAKYHCGAPGDAEDAYPVNSAADAHDAWDLAGHSADPAAVRACVHRAAKAEGWALPGTATMSATFSEPTGRVTRTGKVFEAGSWPEKGLTVTEADLDRMAATFTGADLELEHFTSQEQRTIFDGKLGRLTRVWRSGRDLLGSVDVPAWVDGVWAEAGRKISAAIDPPTTTLLRAGLVLDPAIADAALFSADPAAFAGSRHSAVDQYRIDSALHHLVQAGAHAVPLASQSPGYVVARYAKEPPMSFIETIKAWVAAGTPDDFSPNAPPAPAPVPAPPAQFAAEITALAADRAAMEADKTRLATERATFARDQYWASAQADVTALLTDGHVLPAQNQPGSDGKPALVALFAAAYADDAGGVALFAQSGGSRVAALKACFSAVPAHSLTTDTVPKDGQILAAASAPPSDKLSPERRAELLNYTEMGQKALAQRNGHN